MKKDKSEKKIGFYPMCADILHAGHIIAIEEAKRNCDYLIVGLNCAPEGKMPIQSIYERFIQLRAVKGIDEIIPYQGRADLELIAVTLPYDIRFVGEDYWGKVWDGKVQEEMMQKRVHYLKRRHHLSSSELKLRLISKV
nr:MAG TPA: ADP-heptose synthase, bifunctional sugar kinase/adenylyltransferase [Caudoviricetes sp.]